MFKLFNNGVDLFKIIEEYGLDVLRFFLVINLILGFDIRFLFEKVRVVWGLCNKLWNIVCYIDMFDDDFNFKFSAVDIWINNKFKYL